ncbi:hypothetical protein PR202_ga20846 [Eleusine coracana subsp. coracana]|uniref:DC1 domain-containing protein n=1 Tax=Eleusine coracana subsp. coracana TaxID=191504 RepID=A0AAV5CZI8_ELECO|nr:hypothetical protein QOZ80_8AG0628960 [Eleusine coracana subsp. coracana]GJN03405.1 hypothetical protein PR202_ga20846 [Eleusine coracana subsp. coracana]
MPVAEDVPPPAMIPDHPSHLPGHKLMKRVGNDGHFFMCDGCKEPGAGTRYRCENERCNFDLHTCCAVAPETLKHTLFPNRVFLFLLAEIEPPPASIGAGGNEDNGKRSSSRACVACGEDVLGFVYHCFDDDDDGDGIDLHPCCARLPEHALQDEPVFALSKQASRQRVTSNDDDKRSDGDVVIVHRPAAARHRRWVGTGKTKTGGQDPPPEKRVFERHQVKEAHRPSDCNRGREHQPPPARHRWWKR